MLFVVDIGNTNITLGVFDKEDLVATFRLTTKFPRTSDEYGINICNMIGYYGIKKEDIEGIIVASVVPNVMHSFQNAIVKYFGKQPIIVGPGVKTGIRIATENPRQIGADRIVDAVAAYGIYGGPVIVVDFGTATTYDLVSEDGSFLAGVTAPGVRTAGEALWEKAAKLPEIEICKPKSILGKETISSMQAGLFYGQIGQTEYIIRKMKEECGLENVKTVATGGLGKIIAKETDAIDYYDAMLTLQGLRIIYEKNR